ncbi:hypothetical protein MRB53_037959 [Persea americana]|nr:hypothetical protein MRB53_037959 [Persea americana]
MTTSASISTRALTSFSRIAIAWMEDHSKSTADEVLGDMSGRGSSRDYVICCPQDIKNSLPVTYPKMFVLCHVFHMYLTQQFATR